MYYVLFHYLKGQKERDFRELRSEGEVIDFLHEGHKKIDVHRILRTDNFYNLGLIENEEEPRRPIKLEGGKVPEEIPTRLQPGEKSDADIIQENKETLASTEEVLDKADKAIAKGKRFLDKSSWKLCPACNVNKISPWNKTGKCSLCQLKRKSTVEKK